MAEVFENHGMGWMPDYPDLRDYTVNQREVPVTRKLLGQKKSINAMLKEIGVADLDGVSLPDSVDLKKWCSPVEDQESLGSCTAQAGAGLVEYFQQRAFGEFKDVSRLFIYKATRNMLNLSGDTGAYLRTTMGAMVVFGAPPEKYWPYNIDDFDKEPSAFCYAYAQSFKATSYYRLDPPKTSTKKLLKRIKTNLTGGLPSMFGFVVYNSIKQAAKNGEVPYPTPRERRLGGHAVVAVGYDDNRKIKNKIRGAEETTGALLIRNSWDTKWGNRGYGWLPYAYVLNGLAVDWWSLLSSAWVDTGQFGL